MTDEKQFIGNREIKQISVVDKKTPSGIQIVNIEFTDGTSREFPSTLSDKLKTNEPVDATKLRELNIHPIVNSIMIMLQDNEVSADDYLYLLQVLNESVDKKVEDVLRKIFNVEHIGARTFLQIENIINDNQ